MNETVTESNPQRDLILAAAKARIMHYGYAKTTMAEIARDCDMSAGNIYRFFDSKLDIAEALARQVHDAEHAEMTAICERKDLTASQRLTECRRLLMERSYALLATSDKLLEVAEVLDRERPIYFNSELARQRIWLVTILRDGMASGEFRPIPDPEFTAEMIQSATMKFAYPQLFSNLSIEKLRREFDGVMALILAGLRQN
jgi:AcrR family transcriptional regulator